MYILWSQYQFWCPVPDPCNVLHRVCCFIYFAMHMISSDILDCISYMLYVPDINAVHTANQCIQQLRFVRIGFNLYMCLFVVLCFLFLCWLSWFWVWTSGRINGWGKGMSRIPSNSHSLFSFRGGGMHMCLFCFLLLLIIHGVCIYIYIYIYIYLYCIKQTALSNKYVAGSSQSRCKCWRALFLSQGVSTSSF